MATTCFEDLCKEMQQAFATSSCNSHRNGSIAKSNLPSPSLRKEKSKNKRCVLTMCTQRNRSSTDDLSTLHTADADVPVREDEGPEVVVKRFVQILT